MKFRQLDLLFGIAIGVGLFGGITYPTGAWLAVATAGAVGIIVSTIIEHS